MIMIKYKSDENVDYQQLHIVRIKRVSFWVTVPASLTTKPHSLQSGSCWCVGSRGSWHSCRCPPLLHTRPYPAWHPGQCSSRSCLPPCWCRGEKRRMDKPDYTSKMKKSQWGAFSNDWDTLPTVKYNERL